jgi:WD40 repeat protein
MDRTWVGRVGLVFDAFLSYSHAADGLLAPRLQSGLQAFAKPWWRRRALRVFRDEASLSANPHLWTSIAEALDGSEWFVLLLSPEAASSLWVDREVEHWLRRRDGGRILPIVTGGELVWDEVAGGLDPVRSTAAPPALLGAFREEPRWVDLRWAREELQLDLRNSRFRGAVAEVAAAVRGVAKDELESEEVRQHRRTVRTVWAGGLVVAGLAVVAAGAAVYANGQRAQADAQRIQAEVHRIEAQGEAERAGVAEALARSRELAASAMAVVADDPELAILLALEGVEAAPAPDHVPFETRTALRGATHASLIQLRNPIDFTIGSLGVSPDGSRIYVTSREGRWVRSVEGASWTTVWERSFEVEALWSLPVAVSADGAKVAVAVNDFANFGYKVTPPRSDDVFIPSRLVVFESTTGEEDTVILFPDCHSVNVSPGSFSPLGTWLAMGVSVDWCQNPPRGWQVHLYNAETYHLEHVLDGLSEPELSWSSDESRLAVSGFTAEGEIQATVYDMAILKPVTSLPLINAVISPNGELVAGLRETLGGGLGGGIVDIASGDLFQLEGGQGVLGLHWVDAGSRLVGEVMRADFSGTELVTWDVFSGLAMRRFAQGGGETAMAVDQQGNLHRLDSQHAYTVWDLAREGELEPVRLGSGVPPNPIATVGERGVVRTYDGRWYFDLISGDMVSQSPGFGELLPDGRMLRISDRSDLEAWGPVVIADPVSGDEIEVMGCTISWYGPPGSASPCLDRPGRFVKVEWLLVPPSGAWILVQQDDWAVSVIDTDSLDVTARYQLEDHEEVVAAADSWFVVIEDPRATFRVVDVSTGLILGGGLATGCPEGWWGIELSASGRRLAASSKCGDVHIFDTESWVLEGRFIAHASNPIVGMAFSPEESRLMTSGTDGYVRIFDIPEGSAFDLIPIGNVVDGYWLDESHVGVVTVSGLWTVVTLDLAELQGLARSRLARDFTPSECSAYRIERCLSGPAR